MYVSPGTEPPCTFWLASANARPIVAFAWLYGPIAPMPEFMSSSLRIGPFTSEIVAHDVVLLERAEMPVDAIASTTGKYSGRAPAMTEFTATFSTSNSHASRNAVGRMRPTMRSGGCFVPFSISSTRCSVGSMIGRKSVQRFSMKRWRRLSSVSGGSRRGVERSNVAPFRSSSSSGPSGPRSRPA